MPIVGPELGGGDGVRVLGVVEVINKDGGRHFSQRDEEVMTVLCGHIATSIAQARGEEHPLCRHSRWG
eukprot:gene20766-37251_t